MAASCRIEYPTAALFVFRGPYEFWQLGNENAGCFFIAGNRGAPPDPKQNNSLSGGIGKMSRKILSILISVMLVLVLIPGVASAKGQDLLKVASGSDNCSVIQLKRLEKIVDNANAKIDRAVAKAQRTPENDVAELIATIDAIIAEVNAYADSIGAGIECEYVEYIVDGQTILVDPLRIIPL